MPLRRQICTTRFGATDMGGTITIHTFGAYFGLAVSWALSRTPENFACPVAGHKDNTSLYVAIETLPLLHASLLDRKSVLLVGSFSHRK
jgi:hypothetical protein